ncbi:signal recognition particle 9 kDa protein-domain-containing protein [Hypoxylon fragiforme]|uniref:signal recognition particle 9 kDa protein-domain-containing protein n=1 Tax=Hypoxylon fragiforme TaxID=63214 RepID=UPI0020C5B9B5|nr:signal recognition particle 9 kDa protein-domain-containing protein [Hypoxylon fragiforme]KAI2613054.1 signal recognition particle 9 kDa protein-domain-containing protein [Hypoxylon fragiforme]
MPYYETSQEWLRQSSLLLEARPTTTRITTKYHISKPKPKPKPKARNPPSSSSTEQQQQQQQQSTPRASLTLKTYDPHSGACLKYRTTKAAEVARLITSLGRPLGARMAALPVGEEGGGGGGGGEDEVMVDAPAAVAAVEEGAVVGGGGKEGGKGQAQGGSGAGGGGGKGKKKRGKK